MSKHYLSTRKHYNGRQIGVYAELPVKRSCTCPEPARYRDEDGEMCFRCGHRLAASGLDALPVAERRAPA